MGKKRKIPSPCIDVCKFRRVIEGKKAPRCIGCGMTKKLKKTFKKLDGRRQKLAFIEDLVAAQADMGGYGFWAKAYRKRCRKKGVECPLELLAL